MGEAESVKESRRVLRQVQDHVLNAHLAMGAQQEHVGMVDMIYHPANPMPDLNYITPRRNTAWVSGNYVEQGLARMREVNRTPRVQYIEGLYPPLFARTLRDLGLELEYETPIMVYKTEGINNSEAKPVVLPSLTDSVRIHTVKDQQEIGIWWYIWRNAFYDVLTTGVEPLAVGQDMAALALGRHIDMIAYRHGFPVGVVRVGIHEPAHSGHILALALLREARTPQLTQALTLYALKAALDRGCTIVFAPGVTEDERKLSREMGFMDFGSILCYAAKHKDINEGPDHGLMAQPVLALR